MKKRVIALLLAAVMTVGMLAGCSGSSESGSSTGTDSSEASSSEQGGSTAAETPVSDEKIDVLNQSETMRMTVVCLQDIPSRTARLNSG